MGTRMSFPHTSTGDPFPDPARKSGKLLLLLLAAMLLYYR